MRHVIIISVLLAVFSRLSGQELTGQVSFTGSQNIYVRFSSTEGISPGDTLYLLSNGSLKPVLLVTNLSSTSCVCTQLSDQLLSVADPVIARIRKVKSGIPEKEMKATQNFESQSDTAIREKAETRPKQKIKGSLSVYSYSDFNNTSADNSQRFRYTLSLDAGNIGGSGFSAETYVSFRHKKGEWANVQNDLFNAL